MDLRICEKNKTDNKNRRRNAHLFMRTEEKEKPQKHNKFKKT